MAKLDLVLAIVFGTIFCLALAGSILLFRNALKVSGQKDGDLKMFLWAAGSMICLMIAGMSAAYILIPILIGH
jgi:ABC-type multidrug transport system permease subunit